MSAPLDGQFNPEELLKIKNAILKVMREHELLTVDVGGSSSTEEYTLAVIKSL